MEVDPSCRCCLCMCVHSTQLLEPRNFPQGSTPILETYTVLPACVCPVIVWYTAVVAQKFPMFSGLSSGEQGHMRVVIIGGGPSL